MLRINVTLPNGHHELLALEKSSKVQDLRIAAQHAFGQKFLTLITASNHILVNPEESIEARLKDGENLTGAVLQPQLAATEYAFAFWCHGHKAVTWGHGNFGGDSSAVKAQLWDVMEIQANVGAFAAILADRSVVTWGYFPHGGDSSAVQDQLRSVQQIQTTSYAFAAILADGSVVTWGDAASGGDSSEVQAQLRNVQQIRGSRGAFAAILADGSVVSWGNPVFGGDSSAVQDS